MLDTCPFCSHTRADIYKKDQALRDSEGQSRDFYRCFECGTIHPRPRTDINENLRYLKSMWDRSKQEQNFNYQVCRFDYLTRFLKRYNKIYHFSRALDIGAFIGKFCYLLETLGIEAHGLEPQEGAVEYAQSNNLKVYHGFFPEQMPLELEKNKYDLISCNECIYYFVDLKQSLTRIYKLLSEKGVFLIKAHQGNSHYYSKGHSLFSRYGDYIQSVPTADSLTYCLNSTGFKIKEIMPFPNEYFSIFFGLDRNKIPFIRKVFCRFYFLQRIFNEIYHSLFLDKDRWLKTTDCLIVIAQK